MAWKHERVNKNWNLSGMGDHGCVCVCVQVGGR